MGRSRGTLARNGEKRPGLARPGRHRASALLHSWCSVAAGPTRKRPGDGWSSRYSTSDWRRIRRRRGWWILGGAGRAFEFLGCRLRKCRSVRYPGRMFLQRWPSPRSMGRLRARIRELTDARRNGVKDVRVLIARLNPVLRGWGNYFRTGNATRKFTQIDHYVWQRLGLFLARRRGVRRHRHGAVTRWSFAWFWGLGLYRLLGTVRYPDPAHV